MPHVSTVGQTLDNELEQLRGIGCTKIYREKVTGTHNDRRELLKRLCQVKLDRAQKSPKRDAQSHRRGSIPPCARRLGSEDPAALITREHEMALKVGKCYGPRRAC